LKLTNVTLTLGLVNVLPMGLSFKRAHIDRSLPSGVCLYGIDPHSRQQGPGRTFGV
jgi:hypothetical protein